MYAEKIDGFVHVGMSEDEAADLMSVLGAVTDRSQRQGVDRLHEQLGVAGITPDYSRVRFEDNELYDEEESDVDPFEVTLVLE